MGLISRWNTGPGSCSPCRWTRLGVAALLSAQTGREPALGGRLSKQAAEGHRARPSAPLRVPQPPSVSLAHPTLDLPGAVGVRLAQRGPLALPVSVETLAPALARSSRPRTGLPRFACPPSFGRRETRRPNEGPIPPPFSARERQTTSDNHRPQEPTVRESGVDPVSRALRVLRNQRALPCSAQRPFLRVPGPFRVTCGP